jgi:3,4-dihydroxy 2-butanone 4-phosphate synthase/GTP cyclohydrolase II
MVKREVEVKLPTKFGNFTILGYSNNVDNKEHVVLFKNDDTQKLPCVRLHSECLTGDVFCSLKCDCEEQLANALKFIDKYGHGALIYLRQEGRGIGLINKLRTYKAQENGYDTVDANLLLGFAIDNRDYSIATEILIDLNFLNIKLITNNPQKVDSLRTGGINIVDTINIATTHYPENKAYLATKALKMGHNL